MTSTTETSKIRNPRLVQAEDTLARAEGKITEALRAITAHAKLSGGDPDIDSLMYWAYNDAVDGLAKAETYLSRAHELFGMGREDSELFRLACAMAGTFGQEAVRAAHMVVCYPSVRGA